MLRLVRRSIGRKLMLAVGVPWVLFALVVMLWLRRETAGVAPGLEPVYRIALAALAVFAAGLGITYAIVVRLFVRNPLKRLVAAMRRAREGDFLHRVPVESVDEIGRLAEAYNATLAAVTDLHARRIEDARAMEALERELAVSAEAEKRVRELSFLADLGRTLASTLELDELLRALTERVAQGLDLEAVEVLLADDRTGDLVVRATHGPDTHPVRTRLRPGDPVAGLSTIALRAGEDGTAVLAYRKRGGAATDDDEERVMQSVASQAAMAIANARLHQKTVRLSQTDALTGVHDRRSLFARLEIELERSRRFEDAMAIALVDVDRFGELNEVSGPSSGDGILRQIAALLAGAVRKVDLVARYGGEEFAIVLARMDRAAALETAEQLRARIEAAAIPHGASGKGCVTISLGVAVFPDDGDEVAALIDSADSALYAAKRAGRNAVRAHEHGMLAHPDRDRGRKLTVDVGGSG